MPIFVLTHTVPQRQPKETDQLTFTFVTGGIERAIEQAKTAAQSRDVTVIGGARTAQQALKAGLVDTLHIDIMPVLRLRPRLCIRGCRLLPFQLRACSPC